MESIISDALGYVLGVSVVWVAKAVIKQILSEFK